MSWNFKKVLFRRIYRNVENTYKAYSLIKALIDYLQSGLIDCYKLVNDMFKLQRGVPFRGTKRSSAWQRGKAIFIDCCWSQEQMRRSTLNVVSETRMISQCDIIAPDTKNIICTCISRNYQIDAVAERVDPALLMWIMLLKHKVKSYRLPETADGLYEFAQTLSFPLLNLISIIKY